MNAYGCTKSAGSEGSRRAATHVDVRTGGCASCSSSTGSSVVVSVSVAVGVVICTVCLSLILALVLTLGLSSLVGTALSGIGAVTSSGVACGSGSCSSSADGITLVVERLDGSKVGSNAEEAGRPTTMSAAGYEREGEEKGTDLFHVSATEPSRTAMASTAALACRQSWCPADSHGHDDYLSFWSLLNIAERDLRDC